ncbi:MAG: class I SAM-dependent methyltransferase [Thermoleophilum sp.]|nr:class I SAM-dependent methyltransferase [Thermoleophilum sp.]
MPTLEEIKSRQQATWASGDYGKVAWATVPLADLLVEAVQLRPGAKVLDIATGTGHVALAAARRFCDATGIDYVPALLEVARRRAAAEGLEVDFVEGDAENLPCPDGQFDYALSTIGAMFAPNQERVASEMLRVTRPGGTIGMINWIPEGLVGELFKTVARYAPPPSELKPATMWGSEERVNELLGPGVSDLSFTHGNITMRFLSPEHYADFFLTWFGPIHTAAATMDQATRDAFRADIIDVASRFNRATDGTAAIEAEYLIVKATKR